MTTTLIRVVTAFPVILLASVYMADSLHSKAKLHRYKSSDGYLGNPMSESRGTRTTLSAQNHPHPRRHSRHKQSIRDKYHTSGISTENMNHRMTSSLSPRSLGTNTVYMTHSPGQYVRKRKITKQPYTENLSLRDRDSDMKNSKIEGARNISSDNVVAMANTSSEATASVIESHSSAVLSQLEQNSTSLNDTDVLRTNSNVTLKSNNKTSVCPSCDKRDAEKTYRIESLKHQILHTLKLTKLPNVTGKSKPMVPALLKLYDMDANMLSDQPYRSNRGYHGRRGDPGDDEDFVIKTERVFISAKTCE